MSDALSPRARELIELLGLAPHPEGGWYAEVYRSVAAVDPLDGRSARAALTSIYFLLVSHGTSRWHRVRSDEVWCHLEGHAVMLHEVVEGGDGGRRLRSIELGAHADGRHPQATVPAGRWQAAQLKGDHALVACVVGPGFDFEDFTLMDPESPLARWLQTAHPELDALL